MHNIIQNTQYPKIGGKAKNLILLDKENLTPNFLAIDNNIFMETIEQEKSEKKIKIIIKNTNFSSLITEIKEKLTKLKITNPIIRSSHLLEDSRHASFAGLFDSYKSDLSNIEQIIKKVWLSQFNIRAKIYMQSKNIPTKIGMGIVIQQVIDGEYGGVMFYNKNRKEGMIELTTESPSKIVEGSIKPHKFLIYKGILTSKEEDFKIFPTTLFENLKKEKRKIDKKIKIDNYDIEFIFKNNKISILQIRPLIKDVLINTKHSFLKNQSLNQKDKKELTKMFKSATKYLNLEIKINEFEIKKETILISFDLFKKITDHLEEKVNQDYGEYLKNKCIKLQEILLRITKAKGQRKNLIELKKYLYLMTFIDQLISETTELLEEKIREKYNQEEIENNQTFIPEKPSLSLTTHNIKPKKTSDILIKNIRNFIWLHDANNYFIEKITRKFHKNLIPLSQKNIEAITSKSFEEIKKEKLNYLLTEKIKKREKRKAKHSLPIEGTNINNIDFEGKARLIDFKTGHKNNIENHEIIILEETTPALIAEILKCKGIVTEVGGITSHAAIIARELNKPCLIGAEGCLENIKNGDRIKIIGNNLDIIK